MSNYRLMLPIPLVRIIIHFCMITGHATVVLNFIVVRLHRVVHVHRCVTLHFPVYQLDIRTRSHYLVAVHAVRGRVRAHLAVIHFIVIHSLVMVNFRGARQQTVHVRQPLIGAALQLIRRVRVLRGYAHQDVDLSVVGLWHGDVLVDGTEWSGEVSEYLIVKGTCFHLWSFTAPAAASLFNESTGYLSSHEVVISAL